MPRDQTITTFAQLEAAHSGKATRAQTIRDGAGVRAGVDLGVEAGVTAGLSDAGALSDSNNITITNESQASSASSSGTGTLGDPYIIRDLRFDNSESTTIGFYWNDSDADYYIKLINCELYGYTAYQIRSNTGTTLFVESCKIYDPSPAAFRYGVWSESGTVNCTKTLFAGLGDDAFRFGGGSIDVSNVRFDASESAWVTDACMFQSLDAGGGTATIDHCDFMVNNANVDVLRLWKDATWSITNCYGEDMRYVTSSNMNEDCNSFTMADCHFKDFTAHIVVRFGGQTLNNFDIGYCYFDDNNSGNRLVDIRHSPDNGRVHHCKFKKTTGTKVADNECLEAWFPTNVVFDYNWVEECTEDAYEMISPGVGCAIRDSVADSCEGQIIDLFSDNNNNLPASSQGVTVERIYGESLDDYAVIVTDVGSSGGTGEIEIVDIYASNASAGVASAILLEQRNVTAGTGPNRVHVRGATPLPTESSSSTPFSTTGTLGSDNSAAWFNSSEEYQTLGDVQQAGGARYRLRRRGRKRSYSTL